MADKNAFQELQATLSSRGIDAALGQLVDHLRGNRQYHELFEALKMQVRQRVGVPLSYSDQGDDLSPDKRNQLEEGLLDACREVGLLLIRDGRVREGWMYLRPVGDRRLATEEIGKIEAKDDNLDEMVEVLLHEGVDVARGYQLVLKNYGTCNAITTFDAAVSRQTKHDQQLAAGLLVDHVYGELMLSLRADIARQQGSEPAETTIRELVADRPWLFGEFSYHLDTTHLAATIRVSRLLEDLDQLRKALDMTEYGRRLSPQFQYKGDEPFAEIYPSNALYLGALLGQSVDEAVDFFREKAESLSIHDHGAGPLEAYVRLLARIGRPADAVRELLRLVPSDSRPSGFSGLLLEFSAAANDYQPLMDWCENQQDYLGYATGLLQAAGAKSKS